MRPPLFIAAFVVVMGLILFAVDRPKRIPRWAVAVGFLGPAVLLVLFGLVYPGIRTVWSSFFNRNGSEFVGFDNYVTAFTTDQFQLVLRNTAIWVITVPVVAWKAAPVLDHATLVGWDAEPAGKASLDWGTGWARASSSLLARVPSVVVPEEFNVLVNPTHPDIATVKAEKVRKWLYDIRLAPEASS